MAAELEIILALVGTGVALAALILTQGTAQRRDNAELRRELGSVRDEIHRELSNIRERIARMEGVLDIIRSGMQLPRPDDSPPAAGS